MASAYDEAIRQGESKRASEEARKAAAARMRAAAEASAGSRRNRLALRLLSITTLRSLSLGTDIGAVTLPFSFLVLAMMGVAPQNIPMASAALFAVSVAALGHAFWRRARLLQGNDGLPFVVTGFGFALDANRSYPSAEFEVEFLGEPPPQGEIVALFATIRSFVHKQRVTVEGREGRTLTLKLRSDRGSKFDGHRRWLTRWWIRSRNRAWLPLHDAHPIHEIRFPE